MYFSSAVTLKIAMSGFVVVVVVDHHCSVYFVNSTWQVYWSVSDLNCHKAKLYLVLCWWKMLMTVNLLPVRVLRAAHDLRMIASVLETVHGEVRLRNSLDCASQCHYYYYYYHYYYYALKLVFISFIVNRSYKVLTVKAQSKCNWEYLRRQRS